MLQAQQKWTITPAPKPAAIPGRPYFQITIAGTDRALAATADGELTVAPGFTGAPEQLWRIDQLTDGTYRLMPKAVPGRADAGAGAVGRRQQLADARHVPRRRRSAALADQDAVSRHPRTTS